MYLAAHPHVLLQTMTNAFFLLAQNPEYIGPLRTEIQSVIEEGGWTKASFGRMSKVDSLLKETLRGWNIGICTQVLFNPPARIVY